MNRLLQTVVEALERIYFYPSTGGSGRIEEVQHRLVALRIHHLLAPEEYHTQNNLFDPIGIRPDIVADSHIKTDGPPIISQGRWKRGGVIAPEKAFRPGISSPTLNREYFVLIGESFWAAYLVIRLTM